MTVVFASVNLPNPEPLTSDREILINATRLLSGKIKIQTSTEAGVKFSFKCHTNNSSDISAIIAKIGYSGTLVVHGTSYTNCYIESFKLQEDTDTDWTFDISFVRDTT